jgi:hypothetical protein
MSLAGMRDILLLVLTEQSQNTYSQYGWAGT